MFSKQLFQGDDCCHVKRFTPANDLQRIVPRRTEDITIGLRRCAKRCLFSGLQLLFGGLTFFYIIVYAHGRRLFVYAHGRRLCSNGFRHGSTTISYPQCSMTFLCAYAMSSVGKDVVSSHTKYCRIAYGIKREQNALQGTNE